MVYLDTGSFTFYSGNASQYTFEYQLNNAPSGVSLTDYTHSNDLDYTYRCVNVDSTATDGATFSLSVTAYAVGYESEAIMSNTLSFTVYNPSTATWREELPGLSSFEVTIDGQNEFIPLLKGDHTLAAKTVPENYCETTGTTVTFTLNQISSDFPSLSGNVLTVPDTNCVNCDDAAFTEMKCTIYSPISGKSVTLKVPYFLTAGNDKNPNSFDDWDALFFAYYGEQRGGYFGPGTYPLHFVFRNYNHSDRSSYSLKMVPNSDIVQGVSFSEPTWDGGVTMTVASDAALKGSFTVIQAEYYKLTSSSAPLTYTKTGCFYFALA